MLSAPTLNALETFFLAFFNSETDILVFIYGKLLTNNISILFSPHVFLQNGTVLFPETVTSLDKQLTFDLYFDSIRSLTYLYHTKNNVKSNSN